MSWSRQLRRPRHFPPRKSLLPSAAQEPKTWECHRRVHTRSNGDETATLSPFVSWYTCLGPSVSRRKAMRGVIEAARCGFTHSASGRWFPTRGSPGAFATPWAAPWQWQHHGFPPCCGLPHTGPRATSSVGCCPRLRQASEALLRGWGLATKPPWLVPSAWTKTKPRCGTSRKSLPTGWPGRPRPPCRRRAPRAEGKDHRRSAAPQRHWQPCGEPRRCDRPPVTCLFMPVLQTSCLRGPGACNAVRRQSESGTALG